jgi:hypothetical protein
MIGCLMVGLVSRTQNFDVKFLPGIKDTDPQLVKFEDGYYTVDYQPKGLSVWSAKLNRATHNIILKKYDAAMNELKSVPLPGPDKDFGPIPPVIKLLSNKLYLFYFKLAEDSKIYIYMAAINPATLETGTPIELMLLEEPRNEIYFYLRSTSFSEPDYPDYATFAAAALMFSKTFMIKQSPNGEHCLVGWTSLQSDRLYVATLDKNMKRIQSKIYRSPGKSSFKITSTCIDNAGTAYFTHAYRKKGDIQHEVYISRKDGSEESKTLDFPEGSSIASIRAVADSKADRVWFCGPYTETSDGLVGVYQVALDTKTGVWGTVSKTPFNKELVEIFDKEGWAKTKEKKYGLYQWIIWEANIFNDGILHLTGEFREFVQTQKSGFTTTGSILNASFRDGKAVFTRIPKARVSAGSTYGDSYRIFGYQNKLIVFYNDYPSNLQLDLSAEPKRSDVYTNSALVGAIIRTDGSVTREIVIDKTDENLLSPLSTISELQPGHFFVGLRRIKKLGGITDDVQWTVVKHK